MPHTQDYIESNSKSVKRSEAIAAVVVAVVLAAFFTFVAVTMAGQGEDELLDTGDGMISLMPVTVAENVPYCVVLDVDGDDIVRFRVEEEGVENGKLMEVPADDVFIQISDDNEAKQDEDGRWVVRVDSVTDWRD